MGFEKVFEDVKARILEAVARPVDVEVLSQEAADVMNQMIAKAKEGTLVHSDWDEAVADAAKRLNRN